VKEGKVPVLKNVFLKWSEKKLVNPEEEESRL
jgi:hypothetical protein